MIIQNQMINSNSFRSHLQINYSKGLFDLIGEGFVVDRSTGASITPNYLYVFHAQTEG